MTKSTSPPAKASTGLSELARRESAKYMSDNLRPPPPLNPIPRMLASLLITAAMASLDLAAAVLEEKNPVAPTLGPERLILFQREKK